MNIGGSFVPLTIEHQASELERIRNNQRRSRARRRDYITTLEEKVRNYENLSLGDHCRSKRDPEQLAKENVMLRRLLDSIGFEDTFLQSYLNGSQRAKDLLNSSSRNDSQCCKNENCSQPLIGQVITIFLPVELATDLKSP